MGRQHLGELRKPDAKPNAGVRELAYEARFGIYGDPFF